MEIYVLRAPDNAGKTTFLSRLRTRLSEDYSIEEIFFHKCGCDDFHSLFRSGDKRFLLNSSGDNKITTSRAYILADNCECDLLITACRDTVYNRFRDDLFCGHTPKYIDYNRDDENELLRFFLDIINEYIQFSNTQK